MITELGVSAKRHADWNLDGSTTAPLAIAARLYSTVVSLHRFRRVTGTGNVDLLISCTARSGAAATVAARRVDAQTKRQYYS